METYKFKKSSYKFNCEKCNYYTNRNSQYERHLQTKKHNGNMETKWKQKIDYICECKKMYKTRSGLYKHKKKCSYQNEETKNKSIPNNVMDDENINLNEMFINLLQTNKELQELIIQQQENTKELQNSNKELQNQLLEIAKEPKTIIKNQNQTNNFNLNNFLNIQCKDAMNLSEFIEYVKITFDDLLYLSNHGFVKSVQNTFVKKLSDLEQTKRPIHCTDKKRKAIVVKDNDIWKKDDKHELICGAVNKINKKQIATFSEHSRKRKETYMDSEANQITNSNMIINMCSYNDDNKDKMHKDLLRQIASNTQITK